MVTNNEIGKMSENNYETTNKLETVKIVIVITVIIFTAVAISIFIVIQPAIWK